MRRRIMLLVSLLWLGIRLVSAQDNTINLDTKTGTAYGLAWSPDGSILAVASGHELTLLSADLQTTLAQVTETVVDSPFVGVTWSPDGTQLATVAGYRHPDIEIWNWDEGDGQLTHGLTLHGADEAIDAEMRADNQYGVTWSEAGLLSLVDDQNAHFQLWDVDTMHMADFIRTDYQRPTYQFEWEANEAQIIAVGEDTEGFAVYRLSLENKETEFILRLPEQPTGLTSLGADRLAVVYEGGQVDIYTLASGEIDHAFQGVEQPVAIDWNGGLLAVLDYKTELQVWDVGS